MILCTDNERICFQKFPFCFEILGAKVVHESVAETYAGEQ